MTHRILVDLALFEGKVKENQHICKMAVKYFFILASHFFTCFLMKGKCFGTKFAVRKSTPMAYKKIVDFPDYTMNP